MGYKKRTTLNSGTATTATAATLVGRISLGDAMIFSLDLASTLVLSLYIFRTVLALLFVGRSSRKIRGQDREWCDRAVCLQLSIWDCRLERVTIIENSEQATAIRR